MQVRVLPGERTKKAANPCSSMERVPVYEAEDGSSILSRGARRYGARTHAGSSPARRTQPAATPPARAVRAERRGRDARARARGRCPVSDTRIRFRDTGRENEFRVA